MFYDAMEPLKNRLLTLLIHFPPHLKIKEGLEALRQYDFFFDDTYRYAIEIRHPSWFSDLLIISSRIIISVLSGISWILSRHLQ